MKQVKTLELKALLEVRVSISIILPAGTSEPDREYISWHIWNKCRIALCSTWLIVYGSSNIQLKKLALFPLMNPKR